MTSKTGKPVPETCASGADGAPADTAAAGRGFRSAMEQYQQDAQDVRDDFYLAALAEAQAEVDEAGLSDRPFARRFVRRSADVEAELRNLRQRVRSRGRFSKAGDLQPAYERYLDLQRQDRAEIRALLDRLRELSPNESTQAVRVEVVEVQDGPA